MHLPTKTRSEPNSKLAASKHVVFNHMFFTKKISLPWNSEHSPNWHLSGEMSFSLIQSRLTDCAHACVTTRTMRSFSRF